MCVGDLMGVSLNAQDLESERQWGKMRLKEIQRTAHQAWSPAGHHPIYLALGKCHLECLALNLHTITDHLFPDGHGLIDKF